MKGSEIGLHCSTTPPFPIESRRFTSFRIKHYGYIKPEKRQKKYNFYTEVDQDKNEILIGGSDYSHLLSDGILNVCQYRDNNHLSLNMLLREGEEIDAAGIMTDLWGIAQEINILIKEKTPSTDRLEKIFGAHVFEDKEDVSLPEKRNILIDKSKEKWVLCIDSDEKLEQPHLLRPMMDTYPDGYLMFVKNLHKSGKISMSENVRFFRKDTGFKFSGNVHETVEDSVKENNKIFTSPIQILHFGYLKDDSFLKEKFEKYYEILLEELAKNPKDARVHFSLGLHYLNEGEDEAGMKHLEEAVKLNDRFAEAKKELAHTYIAKGKTLMEDVVRIMPESHPIRNKVINALNNLNEVVEERIRV